MVVVVGVSTVPVCTSVAFTLYSRITPFLSNDGGGDHDRDMVREFTLVPVRFCGEALGAVTEERMNGQHRDMHGVVHFTCFISSYSDSTAK